MSVEFATAPELPPHVVELRNAASALYDEALGFMVEQPELPQNLSLEMSPRGEAIFTYRVDGSKATTNTLSIYRDENSDIVAVFTEQRPLSGQKQLSKVSRRITTYPLGDDGVPSHVVQTGRLDRDFNFSRESATDIAVMSDYEGKFAKNLTGEMKAIIEYAHRKPEPPKPRGLKKVLGTIGIVRAS